MEWNGWHVLGAIRDGVWVGFAVLQHYLNDDIGTASKHVFWE